MGLFITADPHYDDYYMTNYAGRKFDSPDAMNKVMLTNHNTVVTKEDTVIYIGDFSSRDNNYLNFYRVLLRKLNGKKILVLGNHDPLMPFQYIDVGFYSVHTHLEMTINGVEIIIIHDPSHSCIDRNKLFLCGHTHDFIKIRKNCIILCVELWNYFPVSINKIMEKYNYMKERNFDATV